VKKKDKWKALDSPSSLSQSFSEAKLGELAPLRRGTRDGFQDKRQKAQDKSLKTRQRTSEVLLLSFYFYLLSS
jgi:hypothetical protein